jgi:hypothetical protein
MRIDLYTKAVLTIIAIALAVLASNQFISPRVASAQGTFAGLQFSSAGGYSYFFDSRTGEIWSYSIGDGKMQAKRQLTKLGQPLVETKVK